jgi:hypothetical protein
VGIFTPTRRGAMFPAHLPLLGDSFRASAYKLLDEIYKIQNSEVGIETTPDLTPSLPPTCQAGLHNPAFRTRVSASTCHQVSPLTNFQSGAVWTPGGRFTSVCIRCSHRYVAFLADRPGSPPGIVSLNFFSHALNWPTTPVSRRTPPLFRRVLSLD